MSHQCAYRMSIMDSKPTPSFKIELGDKIFLVAHSNVNTLYRNRYQIQVWVQGCVYFSVKYFSGVKYFQERKIFSSVWLHFKNYIRKQFSVFGNILKMLFSYKFFTFSQLFSHLPNKFYIRKNHHHHHKLTSTTHPHQQTTTCHPHNSD